MPRLSDTYPVASLRGKEIIISGHVGEALTSAEVVGDPKQRKLMVPNKYIVGDTTPARTATVSRMQIIQELQDYESVLYSVWEGNSDPDAVTDVMERIIALVLS